MLYVDSARRTIPRAFDDPYLELLRLLDAAASIEHTLMVVYLAALFSIKDDYQAVRGDPSSVSFLEHNPQGPRGSEVLLEPDTFLDVAIEEMQHLGLANRFLIDLGASPNLTPELLGSSSDVYPFTVEPCPLTRFVAATFLWIEADQCALNNAPGCEGTVEPESFVLEVRRVLREGGAQLDEVPVDATVPDHVGSLYNRILEISRQVAEAPPPFLLSTFPWAEHERNMRWIAQEGEVAHYGFFRGVFSGAAFGRDGRVWDDPRAAAYPSHRLTYRSAYPNHPNAIPDPNARQVAWLGNLHYWIVLALLDARYRGPGMALQYHATDVMTRGLWYLGLHLAREYGIGLPFDQLGSSYGLGRDIPCSRAVLVRLVDEAASTARKLEDEGLVPLDYRLSELLASVQAGLHG